MDLYSSPPGPPVGRIQCAPTTGYVQSFKIPMLFPNRIRVVLLKNCPVFVPFGAVCGAYAIRPYSRVRTILRNTDAISQLGTCGPSKNCPVFVPFGTVCGAYSIRPYDRVRAALRKTVPFSSSSGPLMGRIQYAPTTGYVQSFKIPKLFSNWVCAILQKMDLFSSPSGPSVGRIRYTPTTGYVRSFKKCFCFRPLWGRLWGVFNTLL